MQSPTPLRSESHTYYCSQLGVTDLDEILAIEEAVYSHPWTRGNFLDSFANPHEAIGIRTQNGALIAYFFLMPVLEELHLLTFAVSSRYQGQGYARVLLEQMMAMASIRKYLSIMLEVRISNLRAQGIYKQFGFVEIGRRKAYYPVDQFNREDAIVMRIQIPEIINHG
ncbi:ribosomal protein S18-alanine N-acetyltransferase [Undibacterium sp. Di24W]|uniref:ribosomal protein S18-alanine N-acetyltransferase n=1 Tax=Undibacterium sp. Di24W TaxID=3413033 RepID=UPI003BF118BD